jgi:hypothetical protein
MRPTPELKRQATFEMCGFGMARNRQFHSTGRPVAIVHRFALTFDAENQDGIALHARVLKILRDFPGYSVLR